MTPELLRALLDYDPETGVFRWRLRTTPNHKVGDVAGIKWNNGYIVISILNTRYVAHRLAWFYVHGKFPSKILDHKNGIRDDNRIANLRDATAAQNAINSKPPKNNKHGFRGVSWHPRDKLWQARLSINGKKKSLGYFKTPSEAHNRYCAAIREHYGEFTHPSLSEK